MKIAYFHLFFNITTAIIMTPLIQFLVKFVCWAIKDKEPPIEYIEWFIKDKDSNNAILDSRPSTKSINISESNDNYSEDIINNANDIGHKDDIIIKDEIDNKNEIIRKDSSEFSETDRNTNNIENSEEKEENINNDNNNNEKKNNEEEIDKLNNDD